MKKHLPLLIVVLVLVIAACGAAWYYTRSRDRVPTTDAVFAEIIARVDTDHDGRISLEEWKAYGGNKDVFDAYDFDTDGFLSNQEFQAMFYSLDPKPNI